MKRFAIIGAGGYIAPRHLAAIRDTGNIVVAAMDVRDCSAIVHSYFPEAKIFYNESAFEHYLHSLQKNGAGIDHLSVCSPNHLHTRHVIMGLHAGADVICEKPLMRDLRDAGTIKAAIRATGKQVYTILQLRLHESIAYRKEKICCGDPERFRVSLQCIMPRDRKYYDSWKGNSYLSGGIVMNIGIHYFDLLLYLFGACTVCETACVTDTRAHGKMMLEKADVDWFISTEASDLPHHISPVKLLRINHAEVSLDHASEELHLKSYRSILAGGGFLLKDVMPSIELTNLINMHHAKCSGVLMQRCDAK